MSNMDSTRRRFRSASGRATFVATDSTDVVLTTVKDSTYTIFVEEISIVIKTDAAQTITFQDTAATPIFIEKTDSSPGANTQYRWVFAGEGKACTEGKSFGMVFSAAGLAGHVQWTGHQRKTS